MRVIHFIPSAFDYFEDIRSDAFTLVHALQDFGVESEVYTMQYGQPSQTKNAETQQAVRASAPQHTFMGITPYKEAFKSLENFDILHVHCPLLGILPKILRWKKEHPSATLVCTYYRPVLTSDFFSYFVQWYNSYYIEKLFKAADFIFFPNDALYNEKTRDTSWMRQKSTVIDASEDFLGDNLLSNEQMPELDASRRLALKYSFVYNKLTQRS